MGDSVDITTWPASQYLFYKVTSSALNFEVKARGNAVIGLARNPHSVIYWICINDSLNNGMTWIKKIDETKKFITTPNMLNANEFKKFWLLWNNSNIQLGVHGETEPIVSCQADFQDLYYITFTVLDESNTAHWKLHVSPVLPKTSLRPINGGKLSWVKVEDQLPDESIIGGFENESLYIIRAEHRRSLTPGKFVPYEGVGYIAWGGQAHEVSTFKVLCGFDCKWVATEGNEIPVGAIEGGYSEHNHEILYVGRAMHEGHLIPGKVQPSHKTCYIPYKGLEVAKSSYEILVDPFNNCRSVNTRF